MFLEWTGSAFFIASTCIYIKKHEMSLSKVVFRVLPLCILVLCLSLYTKRLHDKKTWVFDLLCTLASIVSCLLWTDTVWMAIYLTEVCPFWQKTVISVIFKQSPDLTWSVSKLTSFEDVVVIRLEWSLEEE
jgi:uncharacterized membrane protein YhaH (DUF805 family)